MGRRRSEVEVDAELARMFRSHGFDGVTLSDFERQTGMARASLYYRFPEGKDSMARAALENIASSLRTGVLADMDAAEPARALKLLQHGLLDYYEDGRLGCVLGAFSTPATALKFRPEMQSLVALLLSSVERLAVRLGASRAGAKARAEDFVADVQGSLVLAAISGKPRTFVRRLAVAIGRLG
jgi:TetR/AcrR family transcriptional regulator, lmrAB and yxaGH operons repressor